MRWTDEMDAYFMEIVPGHEEREIRALFEERFGVSLTEGQIGNRKTRLGVRSGTHGGRFEKGKAGGFQSEEHRRRFIEGGKATRFRKGNLSGFALQHVGRIGQERMSKDGYVEVKVSDGFQDKANSNFKLKHRVVWEQHHGPIPKGCLVRFKDGDRHNFDIDNLMLVSRAEHRVMNNRKLRGIAPETAKLMADVMMKVNELSGSGKETT